MIKDFYCWNTSDTFFVGEQTNVTAQDGALILTEATSLGSYTTPEIECAPFSALVASWNTDTPPGTWAEVQVRVRVQANWSEWLSYGKWSPFLAQRASAPVQQAQADARGVHMDTDTVRIGGAGGDAFQLRVLLSGTSTRAARPHEAVFETAAQPCLRLLSAALFLLRSTPERGEPLTRCVPVPAYSQSIRDPQMAAVICSPTTIAMLMNRFGEDVLPEEAALACYDNTYADFGNWSFSTALAGCYGYECYVRFADIALLKQEIKHGFGCGVSVRYTNCSATAAEKGLPLVQGTTGTTQGHLLVVRGFETEEDGTQYVLVNDSYATYDSAAQRRYLLDEFEAAWNGMAYFLHAKQPSATLCPPQRICAALSRAELPGEYALTLNGERRSLPVAFTQENGVCTGSVCYALHEAQAYATTAHKCFFYGKVSQNGNVVLDCSVSAAAGEALRFTVFLIGRAGITYVAELTL